MVTKNPCILLVKHYPVLSRIGCVVISNAIIQSRILIPSIPHFIVFLIQIIFLGVIPVQHSKNAIPVLSPLLVEPRLETSHLFAVIICIIQLQPTLFLVKVRFKLLIFTGTSSVCFPLLLQELHMPRGDNVRFRRLLRWIQSRCHPTISLLLLGWPSLLELLLVGTEHRLAPALSFL